MISFVFVVTASLFVAAVIVVAVVSVGSRSEDQAASLRGAPPGPVAAVARRITGLHVRTPEKPAARQNKYSSQYGHVGSAYSTPGTEAGKVRH